MPIKVQRDLPARAILESENIFIMDEDRAMSQDIRPLEILILNLMPFKRRYRNTAASCAVQYTAAGGLYHF